MYKSRKCMELMEASDPRIAGNWNLIWKVKAPHKIQIFLWKLESHMLPTREILHNRISYDISPECPKCRGVIESSYHIFWGSIEARSIWNMVANWWSLNQSQRSKLGNNLRETLLLFKGKFLSTIWMTSVASVLWSLWLRRNNLVFNSHYELLRTTT